MRAVKLDDHLVTVTAQGVTNPAVAWQQDRKGDYLLTPILVGSCIYDCQDGIVNCFDAKTGDVKYSERLGDGTEGFTASPVSDGLNIYFTSETGKVYVVPATGAFSVAASNKLNDTCLASAAVSDGTIFSPTPRELLPIGMPLVSDAGGVGACAPRNRGEHTRPRLSRLAPSPTASSALHSTPPLTPVSEASYIRACRSSWESGPDTCHLHLRRWGRRNPSSNSQCSARKHRRD